MKDLSRRIELEPEEHQDLVAKLRDEGFQVFEYMTESKIFHPDTPKGKQVGRLEKACGKYNLTVYSPEYLNMKMNPLEEFMVTY